MTLRFARLLAACALFLVWVCALPGAAAAEEGLNLDKKFGEVKGWKIGFSFYVKGCLAVAAFEDQTSVWVGFGGEQSSAYIAFSNPNWKFIQPKEEYNVNIQTRRGNWRGKFIGFEHDNAQGVYATGLKAAFIGELAASAGIRVYLNGKLLTKPSLYGSREALTSLVACQKKYLEIAARSDSSDKEPKGKQEKSSGTGFFVSSEGYVLTNNHVVDGCSLLRIITPESITTEVSVVAKDKTNDLALVRSSSRPAAVPAFRAPPRLGESIAVFGFPLSGILSSSGNFTVGTVTAINGLEDDSRMLQISAPVQPGNSGGPLIDKYGNILGVIVSKLDALNVASATHDIPQNVNFAIKSSIAVNFLSSNGLAPNEAAKSQELPPDAIAELAKGFTVRVLCN